MQYFLVFIAWHKQPHSPFVSGNVLNSFDFWFWGLAIAGASIFFSFIFEVLMRHAFERKVERHMLMEEQIEFFRVHKKGLTIMPLDEEKG